MFQNSRAQRGMFFSNVWSCSFPRESDFPFICPGDGLRFGLLFLEMILSSGVDSEPGASEPSTVAVRPGWPPAAIVHFEVRFTRLLQGFSGLQKEPLRPQVRPGTYRGKLQEAQVPERVFPG